MRLSNRQTFVPLCLLDRIRLRRAALRYARHGWAVTPGACLDGHRFACGRPGCPIMGCHPAIESWEDDASTDTGRVMSWWRHRPHSVLLATGFKFDVLEVPASLGLRVAVTARGPVAVTPGGRWMFFVRPGTPLRAELAHCPDVVRHGRGSWIPAAPSRMPDGPVRWVVNPDRTGWQLPVAETVQCMLIDAIDKRGVVVPRQMSTSRRAA
jgi:hypothetical protein